MEVGLASVSWSGAVVLGGDGEVTGGAEKDGKWGGGGASGGAAANGGVTCGGCASLVRGKRER